MPEIDERPAADPPGRGSSPARRLIPLWLLLPACVWWIDFGAGLLRIVRPAAIWFPPLAGVSLGFLWGLFDVRSWTARPSGRPPEGERAPSRPATLGAAAYLFAGAAFFFLLGPGIAPAGSPAARSLVGAMILGLAWTGWTALHPVTRRLAFRFLRSIRGGR
jgi:hypothetical protein